jgi:hypothetical protein
VVLGLQNKIVERKGETYVEDKVVDVETYYHQEVILTSLNITDE